MAVNACRLVVALTFTLSGFVKAVDPMGTAYKLSDYAEAFGLLAYTPEFLTVAASVALSAVEFSLGVWLLFGIHRRLVGRLLLVVMCVFTPLTLWLALSNPVSDCGCFGDALKLTNWQTFWKNVALLAMVAPIVWKPAAMGRFVSRGSQWLVVNYTALFILAVSAHSLYALPPFDFRPYHVGADLRQGMTVPEGAPQPKFETTFTMEKDGVRREFTMDDYPDSTWTFIDSRTEQTEAGYVPPMADFSMTAVEGGADLLDEVLADTGYTFLLVAPYLEKADDSHLDRINAAYDYAEEQGYPFYCLTASGDRAMERWRDMTGAEYPFCHTDGTVLQTIIRSNPGLVLLHDGRVVRKWGCNQLPDEAQLTGRLERNGLGQMPADSVPRKVFFVLLWYVLPLALLTIADRTWQWTRWVRKKEKQNKIYQLFIKPKRTMRKKIVAGNWKMNMSLQDGVALAKELNETLTAEKPNCGVVICTPFIHLASIAQFLDQSVIGLGAENCADKEKGAYTGEVSAEMVKSTGAQYVILGHSERRGYYGETPEILKEKVQLALKNGLKVIFCIGESLEEREQGKQNEVVKAELEGSVFNLSAEEFKNIIVAYEPIWAIGTGKTATAEQAEEIHAYIRSVIADKFGAAVADDTTILYGGSCKASNAPELFAKPDIDGGLIGGASLKAADFKGIIDAWKK